MPAELPPEYASERRDRIACPGCGKPYDVSGYLRGTMFSCESCDTVLVTDGPAAAPAAIPEPPVTKIHRSEGPAPSAVGSPPPGAPSPPPGDPLPEPPSPRQARKGDPGRPTPDYSYEMFAQALAGAQSSEGEPGPDGEGTSAPGDGGLEPPAEFHRPGSIPEAPSSPLPAPAPEPEHGGVIR